MQGLTWKVRQIKPSQHTLYIILLMITCSFLYINIQGLSTEGVEIVCQSSDIVIPQGSQCLQMKLQVTPRTCGQLTVTGIIKY